MKSTVSLLTLFLFVQAVQVTIIHTNIVLIGGVGKRRTSVALSISISNSLADVSFFVKTYLPSLKLKTFCFIDPHQDVSAESEFFLRGERFYWDLLSLLLSS